MKTQNQDSLELDINIPPNFNIYAESQKNIEDQDIQLFQPVPRLGETNPITSSSLSSQPINFKDKKMEKLDLEKILNPYSGNINEMGKELEFYREKVMVQNKDLENLKNLKDTLMERSKYGGGDIDDIKREKEALRSLLVTNEHTQKVNQSDDFFDQPAQVIVNAQPQPIRFQEVIYQEEPQMNVFSQTNQQFVQQQPQVQNQQRIVNQNNVSYVSHSNTSGLNFQNYQPYHGQDNRVSSYQYQQPNQSQNYSVANQGGDNFIRKVYH